MSFQDLHRLLEVAAPQHGVVSRRQALDAGLTDRRLARLRTAGVLETILPGMFRVPGEWGWRQSHWVAQLVVGSDVRVSHRAAARLLELEGFDGSSPEVTVPHDRRIELPDLKVHRSTDIAGERAVRREGLWVTTPTRTLVDLGGVVPQAQLEVALDDALRRGLTTQDRLWESIDRLGRPGRSGVPQLRHLLVARGDADGLPETGFETLLLRALRGAGLPRPTVQHEIRDHDGSFVMRLDAAYVAERVGIEADSKRWHGVDRRFESDREKRACVAALGWTIVPVTYRQVTRRPGWVGETVARTLSRAGASPAA